MVKLRKIVLIVCLIVAWGAACVKTSHTTPAIPTTPPQKGSDSLSYLALGDSYTIGESVSVDDRYPVQAVRRLQADSLYYRTPDIIAVTGWTTGNLLAATPGTPPSSPYHIVSILIGVNNQYQHRSQSEYRTEFTALLERSIRLAGDKPSHVIVLSIPDYSVTPFASGSDKAYIAAQIDSFNVINKEITMAYQAVYLDVTEESRKAATDPSLIAGDGLHFSGKEYNIWAGMMEPLIKTIH